MSSLKKRPSSAGYGAAKSRRCERHFPRVASCNGGRYNASL